MYVLLDPSEYRLTHFHQYRVTILVNGYLMKKLTIEVFIISLIYWHYLVGVPSRFNIIYRLRPLIRDPRNLIRLIPAKGTRVINLRFWLIKS